MITLGHHCIYEYRPNGKGIFFAQHRPSISVYPVYKQTEIKSYSFWHKHFHPQNYVQIHAKTETVFFSGLV